MVLGAECPPDVLVFAFVDSFEPRARRGERSREGRGRADRRRSVLAVLVVVVSAIVIVVALASGGGGGRSAPAHHVRAAAAGRTHGAGAAASSGHVVTTGGVISTVSPAARGGAPGSTPVPVLMYHVIAPPPPGAPFPGLYVPASEFASQMQALKAAGWHAVTLDQLEAYWSRGVPLGPGKPIVLTFDNGYHSQYIQALPILRRLGWVGNENMQLTGLPPSQGGLTDAQIRALVAAGWELDTQGISHADLITLGSSQLHDQVAVARKTIQQRFHVPVHWFCYPSGHYDATVIAAVRAAGYVGSTTVVPGWTHPTDDPYTLHRLRVLGGTSAAALLSQIAVARTDPPAPPSYSG
jgi:peptidoglycan/xylan/chitin deacetylase (PgdA/CDA1 family)